MKIIRQSCENEMVYEFLKMEIASSRYSGEIKAVLDELGIPVEVITDGSVLSAEENTARAEVLNRFRGYGRNDELFTNYPSTVNWVWASFGIDDMDKIIYIEYSYWNELSDYTGSPVEAAKTIRAGKTIYDVPNDGFIKAEESLKNGTVFPPLIFLTEETESRYILLEGHLRMTAYALQPEFFQDITALVGFCSSQKLDKWYGVMPQKGEHT
ncbi:MAG: hypothetical protein FWC32_00070 [Firmicutes bacterium]|nr:hypothetical protein [Bacillota bacterium]